MSNTVSKFSISMPSYIYRQLSAQLGKREVSSFIASAVEEKLLDVSAGDSVEAFIALRRRLPKVTGQALKEAIGQGRL